VKNLERVYAMIFAKIYPLYIAKVEKKGRTKEELDEVIQWLTGYTPEGLDQLVKDERNMRDFIDEAPALHPNRTLIKGVVCGVRVEEVEDRIMREIRYLDKLVEELSRGRKMEKILRTE